MLGFPPALRWAWQRQDSDSNIQLPTFKVSIPGGPADSNIPSWSGDGETCPWQKLSNQAECQVVTIRGQGKTVTANRSPPPPLPQKRPPCQTRTSRSLPHSSAEGWCWGTQQKARQHATAGLLCPSDPWPLCRRGHSMVDYVWGVGGICRFSW